MDENIMFQLKVSVSFAFNAVTHGMKNNISFETVNKIMEMCSDDTKQLITSNIFISN